MIIFCDQWRAPMDLLDLIWWPTDSPNRPFNCLDWSTSHYSNIIGTHSRLLANLFGHYLGSNWEKRVHFEQLRDHSRTIFGQLWDHCGTAFTPLWDNFETTFRQLWNNFWTALKQLCTTFGQLLTTWYWRYQIFLKEALVTKTKVQLIWRSSNQNHHALCMLCLLSGKKCKK